MNRILRVLEACQRLHNSLQALGSAGLQSQPPNGLDFQQRRAVDVRPRARWRCSVLQMLVGSAVPTVYQWLL